MICRSKKNYPSDYLYTQPPYSKGSSAYYHTFYEEWLNVFIVSAEVYAFGCIIYLLLGSGTKQDWADGESNNAEHHTNNGESNNTEYHNNKEIAMEGAISHAQQ